MIILKHMYSISIGTACLIWIFHYRVYHLIGCSVFTYVLSTYVLHIHTKVEKFDSSSSIGKYILSNQWLLRNYPVINLIVVFGYLVISYFFFGGGNVSESSLNHLGTVIVEIDVNIYLN